MSTEQILRKGKYYSVIGGHFKTQVPADHPDAEVRNYELKDGTKGSKIEKTVTALFGKITNISIYDGDFGKNLQITLDPNEDGDEPVISLNISTPFGEDMLKKLPNIDLEKEYRFMPFVFIPEGSEKERKGISVHSKDNEGKFTVKVENYFYDAEAKKALNGYPTPQGDVSEYNSDDWKIFYLQARKFLVEYTEKNILPKFAEKPAKEVDYPENINEPAF